MNQSKYIPFLLLLLVSLSTATLAQKSKQQLEKEKAENIARIKEAENILQSTEKKKKATLGQLTALNQQIKSRRGLIRSIRSEIKWYENEISDTELIISSLENDLTDLKKEYASMLYASYKASGYQSRLMFLFAAETFNQFLVRLKYMEQYSEYRRNQAAEIILVTQLLQNELVAFDNIKQEKKDLLNEQIEEQQKLTQLQKKQNTLIAELSEREEDLKKELTSRNNAIAKINKMIEDIVKAELAARTSSDNSLIKTLSTNFEGNRTKLPWPVNEGFISLGFGRQKYPGLKRVEIDNKGINIQTNPNQEIKAVFKGKVTVVASIPGMNKAIIVQHGDYRTVYANLSEVFVTANQEIDTNESIGKIYTDKDGTAELHFELWIKNQTLNPVKWLASK